VTEFIHYSKQVYDNKQHNDHGRLIPCNINWEDY
jgi:hypothetical protein